MLTTSRELAVVDITRRERIAGEMAAREGVGLFSNLDATENVETWTAVLAIIAGKGKIGIFINDTVQLGGETQKKMREAFGNKPSIFFVLFS